LLAVGTRAEISNASGNQYSTPVDPRTGRFAFKNIAPGTYELSGTIGGMNTRSSVVVRSDVDNVALTLSAGVDLQVHAVIETANGKPARQEDMAVLRPYLGDDPPSPRDAYLGTFLTKPDGTTTIPNVTAGAYRVYVQPLLNSVIATADTKTVSPSMELAYVKSIKLRDADALNHALQFPGRANSVLEVVVGTNPGTISGRVLNDKGAATVGALVTALPESPQLRVFRSDMYKTASTDTAGRFGLKGLPPGDYKVFAWAGVEKDAWMDPYFLGANEERGTKIHIEEGQTQNADLSLIPPKF
jgi:hypothetical protein